MNEKLHDVVNRNIIPPIYLYTSYKAINQSKEFLIDRLTALRDKGVISSESHTLLSSLVKGDYRFDPGGIFSILLEEARVLGEGEITFEGLSQAKNAPAFQEVARHYYESKSIHKEGMNDSLSRFFTEVSKLSATCKVNWLDEEYGDPQEYGEMWRAVVGQRFRDESKTFLTKMRSEIQSLEDMHNGEESEHYLNAIDEMISTSLLREPSLINAVAANPLRGVTLTNLAEIARLREEYNWDWALAAVDFGTGEEV